MKPTLTELTEQLVAVVKQNSPRSAWTVEECLDRQHIQDVIDGHEQPAPWLLELISDSRRYDELVAKKTLTPAELIEFENLT